MIGCGVCNIGCYRLSDGNRYAGVSLNAFSGHHAGGDRHTGDGSHASGCYHADDGRNLHLAPSNK